MPDRSDWPKVTIDDAFITIHGVTPDGGDHLIPRWFRGPLLDALARDAGDVEVEIHDGCLYTMAVQDEAEGIEPRNAETPDYSLRGRFLVIPMEDE